MGGGSTYFVRVLGARAREFKVDDDNLIGVLDEPF